MKGHITQRSTGSWSVVISLGYGPDGKRKQKWSTVHGTKKDAQRELNRLLHELDTGTYVEPSKLTVEAFLEQWLKDYAKANVTGKTYERYCQIIGASIVPAIGHHRLENLKPLHIQSYYTTARDSGRADGSGGLSPRTVLQHHRILRQALHHAVKWQLLARNPADAVEPPRYENREMLTISQTDVKTLIATAEGSRFYMPILLAATTGMRRGEILALRWQDIDLDAGTLTVRRSLEQTKDGLSYKEPKTQKSRRSVALPSMTVEALRQHKAKQAERRLFMGDDYSNEGLVCATLYGHPMNPNNFSSDFQDILVKAKLPHIRFHDLRHTHATILLQEGVHPKVVSERLGHSTIGITLDVYSHVLPTMQEEAARKLDNALRAASDDDRKDSVA